MCMIQVSFPILYQYSIRSKKSWMSQWHLRDRSLPVPLTVAVSIYGDDRQWYESYVWLRLPYPKNGTFMPSVFKPSHMQYEWSPSSHQLQTWHRIILDLIFSQCSTAKLMPVTPKIPTTTMVFKVQTIKGTSPTRMTIQRGSEILKVVHSLSSVPLADMFMFIAGSAKGGNGNGGKGTNGKGVGGSATSGSVKF